MTKVELLEWLSRIADSPELTIESAVASMEVRGEAPTEGTDTWSPGDVTVVIELKRERRMA